MTTAFVFPGQGSQYIGMGKSLYAASPICREVFDTVDAAIGFPLTALMAEGDEAELRLTRNVQPALMAVSVAAARLLCEQAGKADISALCQAVAGHSLGEYSALTAAGAISVADAARVLRARGEAMQKAVPVGEGAMLAVIGLEMDALETLVREVDALEVGVCNIANDNAPGQVVLSGAAKAIEVAAEKAKEVGAKRALPLPVSAPFHCALMHDAQETMREKLAELDIARPVVPCYANVNTEPTLDIETIRQNLIDQVCGRVRWRESIVRMLKDGMTHYLELGAGKVLSGLIKRIDKSASSVSLQEAEDISAYLSDE